MEAEPTPRQIVITTSPFERDFMGDVTYSTQLAEQLRERGEEAAYIRGLKNEADIFDFLRAVDGRDVRQTLHLVQNNAGVETLPHYTQHPAAKRQVLSLQLRLPSTGSTITPEGLKRFSDTPNHYSLVTVHEFTILRPPEAARTLEYLHVADRLIFTTEEERQAASKAYGERYGDPQDVLRKSSVVHGMYTTPVSAQSDAEIAQRPKDLLMFCSMRFTKGLNQAVVLAKRMQTDPGMKGKTLHLAGSIANEFVVIDLLRNVYGDAVLEREFFHWPPGEFERRFQAARETDHDGSYYNLNSYYDLLSLVVMDYFREKGAPYDGRCARPADFLPFVELRAFIRRMNEQNVPTQMPVRIHPEPDNEALGKLMEQCTYSYMPLDRGADYHSGSVPGLMANGLILFSNTGKCTPDALKHGAALLDLDHGEIVDEMRRRDHDHDLNRMTRAAAHAYTRELSPAANAAQYSQVIDELIREKDAARVPGAEVSGPLAVMLEKGVGAAL